ncbi:MAG: 1-deoxy-D-xylulose-5-phosphate synthase, partial [Planctomycetes bacterium]|nr:1-deoxy-D-xylulose-5-phosphate synthase [Planctomycetota bacterium]
VGGFIFEELGFSYYGPVDGHNIPRVVSMLQDVKRFKKPVILHIITEKGRGSDPALNDPYRFHGVGPGKLKSVSQPEKSDKIRQELKETGSQTYTQVFGQAITDLGESDIRIVAVTAAMPDGTGLVKFAEKFPKRYFDVGICEQHGVGLAAGLAGSGLKPVVAIYSTFLQRAYDQLFHEVALQKSSVIFMMDRAGLVGSDGCTHNGVFDIAYTRPFPGFTLMAPKDGSELIRMMEFALTLTGPVFIRYPRSNIPEQGLPDPKRTAELKTGRAEILTEGSDGAILAYGSIVSPALAAAEQLAKEDGIKLTVVNARFAKPLDEPLIDRLLREQPLLVTVEEHALKGGFGSAVLEYANQSAAAELKKIIMLGIPDEFIEHGSRDKLLARLGLDQAGIVKAVKTAKEKEPVTRKHE